MELKLTQQELQKEQEEKKKQEQKQKEYDEKVLMMKKEHKFPAWFEQLREYAPGYPLELYAVAWKHNKNEADNQLTRAVNWILDEGKQYMASRPNEFDMYVAATLPAKVEDLTPEQIPDYIADKQHEFWDPKYPTQSWEDIKKLKKKKEDELKLQQEKAKEKLKKKRNGNDKRNRGIE